MGKHIYLMVFLKNTFYLKNIFKEKLGVEQNLENILKFFKNYF